MIAELIDLKKSYQIENHSPKEVLSGVSLEINKGDSIAITGPSGCGKSTLLNILGTLDQASSGIVKIGAQEIQQLADKELAGIRNKTFGFIFQMHHLFPQLNLLENILVPLIPMKDKAIMTAGKKRAMDLLDSVGMADKIHQYPSQLSGGESQRAAVVRALINNPLLILADEPTGSLDEESAEQVGNLLSKLNKEYQVALVTVTHSMSLANKMNHVYSLSKGVLNNF